MTSTPETPEEWDDASRWGFTRFDYMNDPPGEAMPRLHKQALRDRRDYPQFIVRGFRHNYVQALSFLVKACGIPYQHAERFILQVINRRQEAGLSMHAPYYDERRDPAILAANAAHSFKSISDALVWARLYNQARKGTDGQEFWNAVVMHLRTDAHSKFKSIQVLQERDERERDAALKQTKNRI